MNRYLAPLVFSLALTAAQSFAREPQAPPSPVGTESATSSLRPDEQNAGKNIFIGHFGETIRLPYYWTADAFMQGPIEVVNFHLATIDPRALISPPFKPAKKEYVPENLARLNLMQMLVIPKDVPGGYKSLIKLREAKAKELSASGIDHKLLNLGEANWPPDSFQVWISTPYILFQAYTQSDKNFFIVTSGASPYDPYPAANPTLTDSTQQLLGSLSTHLDGFGRQIRAERDLLKNLPGAFIPGATVCAIGMLMAFLPKRLLRLRLSGKAMFGLTGAWHIAATPTLYAAGRLELGQTINEASLLVFAGLITPWICRAVSVKCGGRKSWSTFTWSMIACLLPILLGASVVEDYRTGSNLGTNIDSFLGLSTGLSILGLLNGVAFGLSHREVSTEGDRS